MKYLIPNGFNTIFVLLSLFSDCVYSKTEEIVRTPDTNTFLEALVKLNSASTSLENPEFTEALKTYRLLLMGRDLLGPMGLIGNSFLVTFAESLDVGNSSFPSVSSENGSLSGDIGDTKRSSAEVQDGKPALHGTIDKSDISNNIVECIRDLGRLTSNVTHNEWTWPFIDSWGKPGPSILQGRLNFVGNYKQCRSSKAPPLPGESGGDFTGNYCVLSLTLKNIFTLVGSSSTLQIGSCMPDSCSETDITLIVQQALVQLKMTSTIDVLPTECRTDDREYTAASIAAIVIMSVILALVVCGTLYDLVFVQRSKLTTQHPDRDLLQQATNGNIQPSSRYQPLPDEERAVQTNTEGQKPATLNEESRETKPLLGEGKVYKKTNSSCCGILGQVLLAFSVYSNGSKVLNTAQLPGSLTAINGIRCLSMSWVVMGHMYTAGLADVSNAMEALPVLLKRWTFDAISNALVSVDTFFTLSGLLVAYLTTKEMDKKGWKINWGLFYFHRFWRLTPPYMLAILIYLGLLRFMGSGALWAKVQPMDKTFCEDNWWTNLLYVNNLVRSEQMCFQHSWYLANDMQFYIISPLMLIPFYFNVYAGVASCSIFLLAQWITAGVLSAENEWGPTSLGLNVHVKPGAENYMIGYYYTPYCRIGPYVVGVLAGYLLAVKKGRVKMDKVTVITGWVVSVATALAIVYGIRGYIGGDNPSSVGVAALYNAVSRSAWAVCVCWVIVACSSGYGGPVNTLLSWSPFVSLGRLTYMAYLIHPTIMFVYFGNQDTLYYLNDTNIVITYLGTLLFTYLASFILMLCIESPMIGLEKVLLRTRKA